MAHSSDWDNGLNPLHCHLNSFYPDAFKPVNKMSFQYTISGKVLLKFFQPNIFFSHRWHSIYTRCNSNTDSSSWSNDMWEGRTVWRTSKCAICIQRDLHHTQKRNVKVNNASTDSFLSRVHNSLCFTLYNSVLFWVFLFVYVQIEIC